MLKKLGFATVLVMVAQAVAANDSALLLGVERYATLGRADNGTAIGAAAGPLTQLGFDVQSSMNGSGADMRAAGQRFVENIDQAEAVIASLSGRFVTDGRNDWYLLPESAATDPLGIGADALSVDALLAVLAAAPGRSLLVLGLEESAVPALGSGLRPGLALSDLPQGVTIVRGAPRVVGDYLSRLAAAPGEDAITLAARTRGLSLSGYVPRSLVPVPETRAVAGVGGALNIDRAAEDALWDGTQALDTAQAYLDYLSRYPQGQYAAEASARLAAIQSEPNRADRLAEEAINLSREARRGIQRALTVLEFDTRGIDGIFGPGTRRAITNWQQENGYAQTSYLTLDQINRLDAQAARRTAELEAAAERQRALEEQRDRAYWEETGARGDEPGFRAYLSRYPDGVFSAQATQGLAQIEAAKRSEAEAADAEAWDTARRADTLAAYRTYLSGFPQGSFREEAQSRIDALDRESRNAQSEEAARAAETELRVDPITARLLEARLQQLGLEPGRVDGTFDNDTRRAIRRYQRDRNLDQTGYLNQATVARLLSDAIQGLGR